METGLQWEKWENLGDCMGFKAQDIRDMKYSSTQIYNRKLKSVFLTLDNKFRNIKLICGRCLMKIVLLVGSESKDIIF